MTDPVFRAPWRRRVLLGLLLVELVLVAVVALPSVHNFYDPVGIRDAGTAWTALTWHPADRRHFLPAAVFGHIEGPLQFLFLNAYYHAIGDLLPLDPLTTDLPNVVAAWLAALVAYRLGRLLHGERVGLLAALVLGLMPWLAVAIRLPWVFVTFSTLLELATLYAYVRFAEDDDPRWRVLAPAALAAYLTTGLDWPAFVVVLCLFLVRAGALGSAARNPWNVLPAAVAGAYLLWTISLWVYGRVVEPAHAHLYRETMLLYPFFKLGGANPLPSFGQIGRYIVDTFGITWVIAVGGAAWVAAREVRDGAPVARAERITRGFTLSMAVWLLVFSFPLLRLPSSETYGYVIAAPIAILAALVLVRLRPVYAAGLLVVMVAFQMQPLRGPRVTTAAGDDRRVPAAATFLIEQRPDLLESTKLAFLPGDTACNVGQYARGRNGRILMPVEFPAEMRLTAVGSPEVVLTDFVRAYRERGEIRADWVVLSTEALGASPAAAAFYRGLLTDPRLSWPACFVDARGRGVWVGEQRPGGPAAPRARCQDIATLAEVYTRRYDRIGFLKRDVRHVLHY